MIGESLSFMWKKAIKLASVSIAVIVAVGVLLLWWIRRPPERPMGLSAKALYMETGVVPFKLRSVPGYWIDCWLDGHENVDRCKLTDENGTLKFVDAFLSLEGGPPIPEGDLRFDPKRTGHFWVGSNEQHVRVPVIYLINGQVLLPRSEFEQAKRQLIGP